MERVVVTSLKENTFYALIHLATGDGSLTVDARPSDAIALALRTRSPIFVEEAVIQSAQSVEAGKESMDVSRLRKWLEELSEDELGKYKILSGHTPHKPSHFSLTGPPAPHKMRASP